MHASAPNPAARRRDRQRDDVRRAILDATEDLLVERGYDHFSMRRLADRCGYTAPTIYHHFGDKRGLIDALIDERYERVLERARAVGRRDDPVRTLHALAGEFLRFGLQHPDHYRLLMGHRPDASPPPSAAEEIRALIERPLVELGEAERLRAADVEEALQAIWVLIHGLISMQIDRADHEWSPSLNEFALSAMLRGLVREAPAPGGEPPSRGSS